MSAYTPPRVRFDVYRVTHGSAWGIRRVDAFRVKGRALVIGHLRIAVWVRCAR